MNIPSEGNWPPRYLLVPVDKANVKAVEEIFATNGLSETFPLGVGVDQGLFWQRVIKILYTDLSSTLALTSAVPSHNPTFVSRNFTDAHQYLPQPNRQPKPLP